MGLKYNRATTQVSLEIKLLDFLYGGWEVVWLLKGICHIVLASTCEHGGHRHVRSGGVSTRSHRRDHRDCQLATARDRLFSSHLHAPSVSAVWAPGLSGQAIPADAARLGESRPVVSAGSRGHLFAALLYEVSQVLSRRPLGSGTTRRSVHPSCDGSGGTAGGRRRPALPARELAPLARPPRLCPLCHDPELGRGWGEKRRRRAWTPTSWTGP